MNTVMQNYGPLVSEFQSPEQEQSHDAWLQAKVKSSLADPRPHIPHDQVMAKIDALLTKLGQKAA